MVIQAAVLRNNLQLLHGSRVNPWRTDGTVVLISNIIKARAPMPEILFPSLPKQRLMNPEFWSQENISLSTGHARKTCVMSFPLHCPGIHFLLSDAASVNSRRASSPTTPWATFNLKTVLGCTGGAVGHYKLEIWWPWVKLQRWQTQSTQPRVAQTGTDWTADVAQCQGPLTAKLPVRWATENLALTYAMGTRLSWWNLPTGQHSVWIWAALCVKKRKKNILTP